MCHIAICDDLIEEHEKLTQILQSIDVSRPTIKYFVSGESLLFEYNQGELNLDLIFLDIYMDGINGMITAKNFDNKDIKWL